MKRERICELLRESLRAMALKNDTFQSPPDFLDENMTLDSLGIRTSTASLLLEELRARLGAVPDISLLLFLQEHSQATPIEGGAYSSVKHMISHLQSGIHHQIKNPQVVYVDDEEENLFIFNRKYNSRMRLKTFSNPIEAKEYILNSTEVVLVITDEVMPLLTGNQLRDEVHEAKPFLKFILITGNPTHDGDLLYRSLRSNRFFDFIQKPLNFETNGEKYFQIFSRVLSGDFY